MYGLQDILPFSRFGGTTVVVLTIGVILPFFVARCAYQILTALPRRFSFRVVLTSFLSVLPSTSAWGRHYFTLRNPSCDFLDDLDYSGIIRGRSEILVHDKSIRAPFQYQHNSSTLLPSANSSAFTCSIFFPSNQGRLALGWET